MRKNDKSNNQNYINERKEELLSIKESAAQVISIPEKAKGYEKYDVREFSNFLMTPGQLQDLYQHLINEVFEPIRLPLDFNYLSDPVMAQKDLEEVRAVLKRNTLNEQEAQEECEKAARDLASMFAPLRAEQRVVVPQYQRGPRFFQNKTNPGPEMIAEKPTEAKTHSTLGLNYKIEDVD